LASCREENAEVQKPYLIYIEDFMLAIIIPYYKLTFFRETLESLAVQTDQRFNVYIGNDASPEDPESLLKEFEGKFSFTYKRFDKNLGGTSLTQQWERCIEMMQGEEWFMILGDDDFLDVNFVASFNRVYNADLLSGLHVIKCLAKIVDEEGKVIIDKTQEVKNIGNSSVDCFIAKTKGKINSSLSEHIFSVKKYKEVKFRHYPFAWHSDDFATLQFSSFGKIYILRDALCYVRMSTISISGSSDNLEQKKTASDEFYKDVFSEIRINKLNHEQKLFFAYFWSSYFPQRFNFNAMKLYINTQGFKGLLAYFKIMIYKIFNN